MFPTTDKTLSVSLRWLGWSDNSELLMMAISNEVHSSANTSGSASYDCCVSDRNVAIQRLGWPFWTLTWRKLLAEVSPRRVVGVTNENMFSTTPRGPTNPRWFLMMRRGRSCSHIPHSSQHVMGRPRRVVEKPTSRFRHVMSRTVNRRLCPTWQ